MSNMTADFIVRVLEAKYHWQADRWIFVTELSTMTGVVQTSNRWDPLGALRRIDAFAMALWPSLGYQRVAYEIKLTRSDWLKELEAPIKKAQAYLLSDQFVFALAEGVFHKEDYAKSRSILNCGIYEIFADGKIEKHNIPRRSEPAWPMPETFIASLLRRARQMALKKAADALDEIAMIRYGSRMPADYEFGLSSWIAQLRDDLAMLRDADGGPISRPEDIAKILRLRTALRLLLVEADHMVSHNPDALCDADCLEKARDLLNRADRLEEGAHAS